MTNPIAVPDEDSHRALRARFDRFWRSFSIADATEAWNRLAAAYGEGHRHYHHLGHISDCFEQLDQSPAQPRSAIEFEAAIWFHDVVYKPFSSNNEVESAEWAVATLERAGMTPASLERVQALILATRHAEAPVEADTRLLVDIDLSILGRTSAVFRQYEIDIRGEYRWVPGPLYRRKRAALLRSFLAREQIFSTDDFHHRYEETARANLRASLAVLAP